MPKFITLWKEEPAKNIKTLEKKITQEMEDEYFDTVMNRVTYLGYGVYGYQGYKSNDTRELFLIGIAVREKIDFMYKVKKEEEY